MSLIGTGITEGDKAAWLAERAGSVGASESAAIMGLSRWESPLSVYLRKTGDLPPAAENPKMRIGKLMEPVIATLYREETGREPLSLQRFVRSSGHPWMTATLDCVCEDGRVVEFKNVGPTQAGEWGESGTDEVPAMYLIQATHQMICAGTDVADVAALISGNDFRTYTVPRDDRVAGRIVAATGEFIERVRRREPPPVEPDRDGPLLSRLWPDAVGEVELGPVGEALVEQWERCGGLARENERARERARVGLLELMRDASSARLAGGAVLARKVVHVAGRTTIVKPYEYTMLSIKKGG